MSPEKTAELIKKYPKIFQKSEAGDEPFDSFAFECGDGWFELINVLCQQIQQEVDYNIIYNQNIQPRSKSGALPKTKQLSLQVIASQIKEKFGTLRGHFDNIHCEENKRIKGMISMAEAMSYNICEECGNKATITTTGWIRRLCSSCYLARNKK